MAADTALFVSPHLHVGGAERHIVLLAQHLDRAHWRPRVLTFADGPLGDELRDTGVPVDVVPAPEGPKGVATTAAAIARHLRQTRPAVVSAQHFLADAPTRLAVARHRVATRSRVPYVVWKHTYGHVGHRGLRERAFEAATGRLVDCYGAVSYAQVNYLRAALDLPTRRLRVVQNSLPASPPPDARAALAAALPGPTSGPVAIVVGVLRADKGHDDLLRAWAQVNRSVPDATLLVVGDGPERLRHEATARELGLRGVHFLGSRTDAAVLAAGADVFVLASYNIECFPYAVLEAMAGAIPVVTTATGGLAEMVDHRSTGLLVPPQDPAALGDALVQVLGAPELARALGAAGQRRLAEVFPFARWVDEVNAMYSGLDLRSGRG